MKRIIFVSLMVGVLLFFNFCGGEKLLNAGVPMDCKKDLECFIEASKSCTPAAVTRLQVTHTKMYDLTTSTIWEIEGFAGDKCIFSMEQDKAELEYTEEYIDQMLESGVTKKRLREMLQVTKDQMEKTGQGTKELLKHTNEYSVSGLTSFLESMNKGSDATTSSSDIEK